MRCELLGSEAGRSHAGPGRMASAQRPYLVNPLLISFEKMNETSFHAYGGIPSDVMALESPVSMAVMACSSGVISSLLIDKRWRKSSRV